MHLVTTLKLGQDFVSSDPETWNSGEDCQHAKDTVAALSLINDCAKRAVKLATDFNLALTHDEQQRQLNFQVVEHHRKQMPTALLFHLRRSSHFSDRQ